MNLATLSSTSRQWSRTSGISPINFTHHCEFYRKLPFKKSNWNLGYSLRGHLRDSNQFPTLLSRLEAAGEHRPLSEITAHGPEGIILFGFPPKEIENIQTWLSETGLLVVSGDKVTFKSYSVSDALRLLFDKEHSVDSSDDSFTCFSRVVLFCGLSGKMIEGLIEVWNESLCQGPISYAFTSPEMLKQNLESTLLKVIKASDANEISDQHLDISTKRRLKDLVSNLKRGAEGSRSRSKSKSLGNKGFGK